MSEIETVVNGLREALRRHWPEYLIEAAGLALFMISACLFVALLEYPGSPVRQAVDDASARRALVGLAMGATAIAIVYSPWGKQSGAHLNPAVTLTFYRLGRIEPADAAWYVLAQFVGGIAGVMFAVAILGPHVVSNPAINHVVTMPGMRGTAIAFAAEAAISFVLMLAVLLVSNRRTLNRYTGLVAGALVAIYIAIEAPISGMSMNPARSFGSALPARHWDGLWIYFIAPVLGMLVAAETYLRSNGHGAVLCCKFHHDNDRRCIFRCRYGKSATAIGAGARAGPAEVARWRRASARAIDSQRTPR
jgi:aquaporin Z